MLHNISGASDTAETNLWVLKRGATRCLVSYNIRGSSVKYEAPGIMLEPKSGRVPIHYLAL